MPPDGRLGQREDHKSTTNHTTINRDAGGGIRGGGERNKSNNQPKLGGQNATKTQQIEETVAAAGDVNTTQQSTKYTAIDESERVRLAAGVGVGAHGWQHNNHIRRR